MIIDIQRTVLKTQLRRFFTLVIAIALVVACILLNSFENRLLGFNKYQWALVIGIIYFLILIGESFLELNYIYFHNDAHKLVFRYFSMSYFNRKKNSIEISQQYFQGYEVHKSVWGLKTQLILKEKIKDNIAKYKPVSITALNKKETEMLLKTLDKYKPKS